MNTQNIELDKVKARIKALASKTTDRGCTEHEAMEAMAAVGRLLAQYNLTMNEIDVREQVCKTIYIDMPGQRRGAIDGCMIALADVFHAITWFASKYVKDESTVEGRYIKKTSYAFFGTESDLEMIRYLFDVISKAIQTELAIYKTTEDYLTARRKKSATVSFGHGMSHRIAFRLAQMKRNLDIEAKAHATTGTDLVVLKGQLVQEEFKKGGIKLRTLSVARMIRSDSAYSSGSKAGDRVNLSRPISGGSKVSGYLK